ncbi:hypothetical protein PENTCL1PPCAC_3356, partial [Pristionchus entomophagus]
SWCVEWVVLTSPVENRCYTAEFHNWITKNKVTASTAQTLKNKYTTRKMESHHQPWKQQTGWNAQLSAYTLLFNTSSIAMMR